MAEHESTIVTFYSYKGGVGRSMALANVAWLLAEKYKKDVLVVDWDLEAPGLHRFFDLDDSQIKSGLMDMLYDYKQLLRDATGPLAEDPVQIGKYIQLAVKFSGGGSISILPAGKQNSEYAGRVNQFDWREFYDKWHGFGFIENFKKQLRVANNITLIDSRTGVTDIGGICTLQLPDIAVLLFALNAQNIDGVCRTAGTILAKAPEVPNGKQPKIILRPSRVEKYLEEDKRKVMEELAAERLKGFLPEQEQAHALKYITKKSIPYVGAYGFGETPLVVQKSPLSEMAEAFEDLTNSILGATALQGEIATVPVRKSRVLRMKEGLRVLRASRQLPSAMLIVMVLIVALLSYMYSRSKAEVAASAAELKQAKETVDFANQTLAATSRETELLKERNAELERRLAGRGGQVSASTPLPAPIESAIQVYESKTLEEARYFAARFKGSVGIARIYRKGTFRIIVTFSSPAQAQKELPILRKQYGKNVSLIDIVKWCPMPKGQYGLIDCDSDSKYDAMKK